MSERYSCLNVRETWVSWPSVTRVVSCYDFAENLGAHFARSEQERREQERDSTEGTGASP